MHTIFFVKFNMLTSPVLLCITVVLKLYCLTWYCKRFYRIPLFTIFILFYLFCIYWDWQEQKCKLKFRKVYEINFELYCNCNFCLYSFLRYKQLYLRSHKNTFVAAENPYLNEVFLKSKNSDIQTLQRNFNPKVIGHIIFNKVVCGYVIIAFFQILWQKPKHFQIFQ